MENPGITPLFYYLLRILKYISLKTELTPEFKDNTNKSSGRLSTKCSREEGDSKSAAVAIPTDSYSGEGRRTPGIGNRATPVQPSVHEKVIQDVKRRGKEKQSKNDSGEQYSHSSATIIPTVSAASSQDGKTPGIGNQATHTDTLAYFLTVKTVLGPDMLFSGPQIKKPNCQRIRNHSKVA